MHEHYFWNVVCLQFIDICRKVHIPAERHDLKSKLVKQNVIITDSLRLLSQKKKKYKYKQSSYNQLNHIKALHDELKLDSFKCEWEVYKQY